MDDNTSDVYRAIFDLFGNKCLSAEECLEQTRSILDKNRDVVHEQDADGRTLLHYAAGYAWSPEYCKLILEFDPTHESLQLLDSDGWPPFHFACREGNLATARYLLEMHPESINVTDDEDGYNCLHILLHYRLSHVEDNRIIEFAGFLLSKAPRLIASSTTEGDLPLHIACYGGFRLSVVKFLYNAHPEAIYKRDNDGLTPSAEAQETRIYDDDHDGRISVISFFQEQLAFLAEAGMNWLQDENGQLPIHRAILYDEAHQGTIKLMVSAHAASLRHTDSNRDLPIHLACAYRELDIVKMILERSTNAVLSVQNNEGKIPIQLLLHNCHVDRNSLEYVQVVDAMLRANPADVAHLVD
jgi:ankyrin repeat protein